MKPASEEKITEDTVPEVLIFGASLNRLADVERLAQVGAVLVTPEVAAVEPHEPARTLNAVFAAR